MTCRELAELLIDYVAGELAAEEMARLREHLSECPPCVHYIATYELTIKMTRCLPPAEMPERLMERLRAAVAQNDGRGA